MRRIAVPIVIALAAVVLFAQQQRTESLRSAFEMTSVFPRETAPGEYEQVDPKSLQNLASQGWELVGVTPYIYRNEEHNNGEMHGPKPVITQVYPAYFFRRQPIYRN